MLDKMRSRGMITLMVCLAVGYGLIVADAEEPPEKSATKTGNWPVKFTIQESGGAAPKVQIKQPFYPALTEAEQQIQTTLKAKTECEFAETPLSKVISWFQAKHGINIFLDALSLEEVGLTADEPVNVSLSGIPLKNALDLILGRMGLDYVVDDEVLKITTQEAAARTLKVRIYPVGDLCVTADEYTALENVIEKTCILTARPRSGNYPVGDLVIEKGKQTTVPPQSGIASISVVPQCRALVVNMPARVHQKIVKLLTQLRQVRHDQEKAPLK